MIAHQVNGSMDELHSRWISQDGLHEKQVGANGLTKRIAAYKCNWRGVHPYAGKRSVGTTFEKCVWPMMNSMFGLG